jgi:hypothetical protein
MMAAGLRTDSHQWPPEGALPRLRDYQLYRDIYAGEHERVFCKSGRFRFRYDESRDYVSANLCGALTNLLTHRTCGEVLNISVSGDHPAAEELLEWFAAKNRLSTLLMEAVSRGSCDGDAVFALRYDAADGLIKVSLVDPANYYPERDPADTTRTVAATVGTVLEQEDKSYLWLQRNEIRADGFGWLVNTLYRLHGDQQSGYGYTPEDDAVPLATTTTTANLPEEQNTGIRSLLTVHYRNRRVTPEGFGTSDYAGLLPIQGEINNRLTQRAEVQDKFVDPITYGPDISGEDGQIRLSEEKYIITDVGAEAGAPVGMLVWDAQLPSVDNALKELRELFAATAGIEISSIVPEAGGGPQSGRALRLSQMRTQNTARAKQMHLAEATAQVLLTALELALYLQGQRALAWQPTQGKLEPLELEDITVTFGDGLPQDTLGDIEEQVAMLEARVQSRVDAIAKLHDLTPEAAAEKLAEIDGESSTASHSLSLLTGLTPQRPPVLSLDTTSTQEQPQEQPQEQGGVE